jgi:hypothetical protein
MIEPLRNMEQFSSPDEAEAARLLRALSPADPLPGAEKRVYASLARPRRFGPRALRLASVVSVSLVTTSILAMTGMILLRGEEPKASRAPLSSVPPARPVVVAAPVSPHSPEPAPTVAPQPPVLTEPRAVVRSSPPRPSRAERHSAGTPVDTGSTVAPVPPAPAVDTVESTEARVAAAPPEEAALVLAGLRALRRQHDPAQAGPLFARYLSRFPQGVLVQEAMALDIEASLARGDGKLAGQLAAQYLQRFPTGRFVRQARKAVDGTGP